MVKREETISVTGRHSSDQHPLIESYLLSKINLPVYNRGVDKVSKTRLTKVVEGPDRENDISDGSTVFGLTSLS